MFKKTAATLLFTSALLASDPPREQKLQKAIDLIETKGDLAHAMPLLEEVSRSSDHALAARGLLYLGQAQERQGKDRARSTYERLIKEFSDQTDTAREARRRLTLLSTPPLPDRNIAPRLVLADERNEDESVSLDGRSVAMTRWSGGDNELVIQEISTGQLRRLVVGSCGKPCTMAELPVLSPDSRQVAYTWFDDAEVGGQGQLRLTASEQGAKPRVLARNAEFSIWPSVWSSDGKSILVRVRKQDRTWQVGWVSVADGALKIIKSLEWRGQRLFPTLSPDGRYIAYSALATNPSGPTPAASDPTDRHIYVLAANGSSEIEVVKTAGINEAPIWTPDGQHLLFVSDRSGALDLWAVPIRDGRATDAPSVVKRGIGKIFPSGITRSGTYYYSTLQDGVEQVSIVEMDLAGRNVRTPAASPTTVAVGINPVWSPDGKSMAFLRKNPGDNTGEYLVVHSIETGEEKTYVSPGGSTGLTARITWLHDGKGILLPIADKSGNRMYRVDLKSREFKEIPKLPPIPYAISADDKTAYTLIRDAKNNNISVSALDLASGEQKLTPIEGFFNLPPAQRGGLDSVALSPDGRTLAFFNQAGSEGHLSTAGVDGKNFHDLYSMVGAIANNKLLTWTPDSRAILFGQFGSEGRARVMRIPAEGGDPEFIGLDKIARSHYISLSPDSRGIALSTVNSTIQELWAFDNLSSLLKTAQ